MRQRRLCFLGGYDTEQTDTRVRSRMNGLTQALNDQIRAVVARADSGDQRYPVIYVDDSSAHNGQRYCDVGIQVLEPNMQNPNEQRWFQENDVAEISLTVNDLLTQHGTGNGAHHGATFDVNSNTWLSNGLDRAFHPTVDGQLGIKNVSLAAYKANTPKGVGDGAYALNPFTKLAKKTVAKEALDEPIVTPAPKAIAFKAEALWFGSVS